ncbi:PPE family protein [Mycobacterium sp.]|uniref:PPE family protein n=1 Tax=Mycobacterium sp. TaxID=1785 RepID=UPI002B56AF7D|nr:PPE family protein [Mycobacterium sp.]HTY34875.1 PPE family protein [Mycobacterium sp.]
MDLLALPPEVTSALIHSGPGAGSLIEASAAWQRVTTELENSASIYTTALSTLSESWKGPSSAAMVEAVQPYITWLRNTAQQSQQMAESTQAAAAAFNSALSTVVPPATVAANRTRLAQLVATNAFGRNLPAIAATEEQYQAMWATNSAALSRYQATTAQALDVQQFRSPPAITDPAGTAAQATATSSAATTSAQSTIADFLNALNTPLGFDPNTGWFGLANTWGNQFISSGFPINLLGVWAQLATAQGVQAVGGDIGQGLSEGEAALGAVGANLSGAVRAMGSAAPTGAMGVGVSLGKLTAPPAVVGLLPASQSPVQLASAASPLDGADAGFPMLPPLMPPPISAGSGWRKRKQPNPQELQVGAEVKGKVMRPPPSAG